MMQFPLSDIQCDIYNDPARFRVVVAGRRSGKTHESLVEHVLRAIANPGHRGWHVGPTYRQNKRIAWKPLKAMARQGRGWIKKINESELLIEWFNGAETQLLGADDPDSLRGPGLDFLTMDEFAFARKEAWTEALRPMLSDRQGSAIFATTPAGYNWAYDLYLRGLEGRDNWSSHTFTTAEGGIVTDAELAEAREDLDERTYRQEYEASFEALSGRVYDMFVRKFNCTDEVADPWVKGQPGPELLVGMDFNVNPMSAVLAYKAGDECHVFESLEIQTSNTEEMAREIRNRYPERELVVCPDPSGKSRKTSAPIGQTDYTILRSHGFKVRAPKAAPPVVDRINNTQAMLCSAAGRRRLLVHPRAARLIRGWDGLTYKEGTSQVDKTLGLDHICDAADYLLWQEFNVLVDREFRQTKMVG